MNDLEAMSLSNHLDAAQAHLNSAREKMRSNNVRHREAAVYAIVEAQKHIAHVNALVTETIE